jgi:hypothetical protein
MSGVVGPEQLERMRGMRVLLVGLALLCCARAAPMLLSEEKVDCGNTMSFDSLGIRSESDMLDASASEKFVPLRLMYRADAALKQSSRPRCIVTWAGPVSSSGDRGRVRSVAQSRGLAASDRTLLESSHVGRVVVQVASASSSACFPVISNSLPLVANNTAFIALASHGGDAIVRASGEFMFAARQLGAANGTLFAPASSLFSLEAVAFPLYVVVPHPSCDITVLLFTEVTGAMSWYVWLWTALIGGVAFVATLSYVFMVTDTSPTSPAAIAVALLIYFSVASCAFGLAIECANWHPLPFFPGPTTVPGLSLPAPAIFFLVGLVLSTALFPLAFWRLRLRAIVASLTTILLQLTLALGMCVGLFVKGYLFTGFASFMAIFAGNLYYYTLYAKVVSLLPDDHLYHGTHSYVVTVMMWFPVAVPVSPCALFLSTLALAEDGTAAHHRGHPRVHDGGHPRDGAPPSADEHYRPGDTVVRIFNLLVCSRSVFVLFIPHLVLGSIATAVHPPFLLLLTVFVLVSTWSTVVSVRRYARVMRTWRVHGSVRHDELWEVIIRVLAAPAHTMLLPNKIVCPANAPFNPSDAEAPPPPRALAYNSQGQPVLAPDDDAGLDGLAASPAKTTFSLYSDGAGGDEDEDAAAQGRMPGLPSGVTPARDEADLRDSAVQRCLQDETMMQSPAPARSTDRRRQRSRSQQPPAPRPVVFDNTQIGTIGGRPAAPQPVARFL